MTKILVKAIIYWIVSLIPEAILVRFSAEIFYKRDNSLIARTMRWYWGEYYKHANSQEKRRIIFSLWSSKAGRRYHQNRTISQTAIGGFSERVERVPDCDVVEIGPGNGVLLDALAQLFPTRRCQGVDLNCHQVNINKEKYFDRKNLEFFCGDAVDFLKKTNGGALAVISYAVLTTFTGELVDEFFRVIGSRSLPTTLIMCEPVSPEMAEGDKAEIRGDLALAHNYLNLARSHGLDIIEKTYDWSGPYLWLVCKNSK